jgi:competence protein ComEC
MTLRRTRDGFAVEAVKPGGIDRPWSPGSGEGEADNNIRAPRAGSPRAVDATPAESDLQPDD